MIPSDRVYSSDLWAWPNSANSANFFRMKVAKPRVASASAGRPAWAGGSTDAALAPSGAPPGRQSEHARGEGQREISLRRLSLRRFDDIKTQIVALYRQNDATAHIDLPYIAPRVRLMRWVYGYGQSYIDRELTSELRDYVLGRDGSKVWRGDGSAFRWVARLIATNGQLVGVKDAHWTREIRAMEYANTYDIAPEFLYFFVHGLGGVSGVYELKKVNKKAQLPAWARGMTRVGWAAAKAATH